jgi:hypothetical protein
MAQFALAPICIAPGALFEQRKHCEITEHVNDVVRSECGGRAMTNVLDVADTNGEFGDFVFFDMPGWKSEYGSDCVYRTYFHTLIDRVDYTYVVW